MHKLHYAIMLYHVSVYICTWRPIHVYVCMYVLVCVCMQAKRYVCMCMYMCIDMYIGLMCI